MGGGVAVGREGWGRKRGGGGREEEGGRGGGGGRGRKKEKSEGEIARKRWQATASGREKERVPTGFEKAVEKRTLCLHRTSSWPGW